MCHEMKHKCEKKQVRREQTRDKNIHQLLLRHAECGYRHVELQTYYAHHATQSLISC